MGAPPNSQAVSYPSNLPFRLVSKTIGAGAYASIRKAVPLKSSKPVIAIKFINKEHAMRVGRLSPRQITLEISIHRAVCDGKPHPNIIRLLEYGEDPAWHWIAMELAEGGDLFDKIEADEGVPEDVAHFYFRQLIGAVAWCHSKGIAHRDIKPENMLLSGDGDLKLADFGLGAAYMDPRTGKKKTCQTVCGSPPYIAPEIIATGLANQRRKRNGEVGPKEGYEPDRTDLWSCAIVLFVLLVGNTPWDSPMPDTSAEYAEYLATNGRPNDELWDNIPTESLSLIRGILRVDPTTRFTLQQIQTHPWFLRPNRYMDAKGRQTDSVALATTMMECLRIDLAAPSNRQLTITQATESQDWARAFANTQPETPNSELPFDWEPTAAAAASQPTTATDLTSAAAFTDAAAHLQETDISLSQFTNTQGLPLTLTQAARKFGDIAPREGLTRFYSPVPLEQLIGRIRSVLLEGCMVATMRRTTDNASGGTGHEQDDKACLWVQGMDSRKQELKGSVLFETALRRGSGLVEVRFVKAKGDPVEWRRLFKWVVKGARDVVFVPGEGGRSGGWSQI
ncbi:serine/threonine-protein kinase-11 [Elsinoe australis]|uniref:non-specific serine/threonine protein kinase n=1 Tax=Elsinoe australis TaxID=40998 RepID=A0A4V6DUR2_9PEZI|nr:serine/threonine-protein kinase-11 [Elsinoe australis]